MSPDEGAYHQPCIDPAGVDVVFWGGEGQAKQVWKASLTSLGDAVALTPMGTEAMHPSFSWDGHWIVFAMTTGALRQEGGDPPALVSYAGPRTATASAAGRSFNLFVMRADSTEMRQITHGPYVDERPSFSPDGTVVVFVSDRDGPQRLCTVPVDGRTQPRSLQQEGWGYRPWFAVDGRSIFFFTERNGRQRICHMPAEGGPVDSLPNDDRGRTAGPFADPDGKTLLVVSTRSGKWGIWELPLDGQAPRQLQPPGFESAAHATRASNGDLVFGTIDLP